VRHYTGPGIDLAAGISVDGTGDAYVAGYTSTATGTDVLTLKYSPTGVRRWVRAWDGPAGSADIGNAIAVTKAGTAYVAGSDTGVSSGSDAVVLKYSRNGALLWGRFQSGPGANLDAYDGISLAANGDVLATGEEDSSAANEDALTARLSPRGRTRWVRLYDDPQSLTDAGELVAPGASGALYVTGITVGSTTAIDWLTLKYSAKGKRLWARTYTSSGSTNDFTSALVVHGRHVYVAGELADASFDAAVVAYDP